MSINDIWEMWMVAHMTIVSGGFAYIRIAGRVCINRITDPHVDRRPANHAAVLCQRLGRLMLACKSNQV